MAGNIKGITIQFDADITPFDKAIRNMEKNISKFDKELRQINNALKFNPTSVDLWRQKQQVLTQKIEETRNKLQSLKDQQAAMDAAGVDKNSEEYRKLQREIIETEGKLKTFNAQLKAIGNADLRALGEKFKKIGDQITKAGEAMSKYITAPIVGGFTASAKAALTYGDAIAKMSTIADESQVPVEQLKKQILQLSNETGKGSTELAEAAYQALSASVETKDVMGFLGDATGLAKAGFLETADAVDVLTTIINAYGYSASDANMIANQLIQTQNDGKTTVNELAQAMGQVIPTASALNIPLEQLNAAYVSLTKQGINTANSTTYLNGMFTELADGGSTVSEILQNKTGKTFGQLMKEGYTLGDVMQILNDSVNGDSEAFLNLWGNTRAGKGALALLNGGVEEFNAEALQMANSTGNIEEALDKLSTPGAKARKALNSLVNAGIQIGDVLAPYIEKAVTFIQGLLDKFNELSPSTQKIIVAVAAVAAAIGPLLVVIGTLISSIGSIMIMGPVLLGMLSGIAPVILIVIGVITLLVAVGVTLYKNWDTIKQYAGMLKDWLINTWTAIKTGITNTVNALKATITNIWNGIKTGITNTVNALKATITNIWNGIKLAIFNVVRSVVQKVVGDFGVLKNNVSSIWNSIKSAITNPISTAYNIVKGWISKLKNLFPLHVGKIMTGLKVPHIKVSGGKAPFGIGGKGSAPSINVDWYAQGGIFTRPTLLSNGNRLAGVGEDGPEAVLPISKLQEMVDFGNAPGNAIMQQMMRILLAIYEELQKEKNFKVDGIWAGRYVNSLVR